MDEPNLAGGGGGVKNDTTSSAWATKGLSFDTKGIKEYVDVLQKAAKANEEFFKPFHEIDKASAKVDKFFDNFTKRAKAASSAAKGASNATSGSRSSSADWTGGTSAAPDMNGNFGGKLRTAAGVMNTASAVGSLVKGGRGGMAAAGVGAAQSGGIGALGMSAATAGLVGAGLAGVGTALNYVKGQLPKMMGQDITAQNVTAATPGGINLSRGGAGLSQDFRNIQGVGSQQELFQMVSEIQARTGKSSASSLRSDRVESQGILQSAGGLSLAAPGLGGLGATQALLGLYDPQVVNKLRPYAAELGPKGSPLSPGGARNNSSDILSALAKFVNKNNASPEELTQAINTEGSQQRNFLNSLGAGTADLVGTFVSAQNTFNEKGGKGQFDFGNKDHLKKAGLTDSLFAKELERQKVMEDIRDDINQEILPLVRGFVDLVSGFIGFVRPVFTAAAKASDVVGGVLGFAENTGNTVKKATKSFISRLNPFGDPPENAADLLSSRAKGGANTQGLNPLFREKLAAMMAENPNITITSGYRSNAEQQRLWDQSDKSGVRVARPGRSFHEKGVAADLDDGQQGAWLKANAPRFGLWNYAPEWWHWELSGARKGTSGSSGESSAPSASRPVGKTGGGGSGGDSRGALPSLRFSGDVYGSVDEADTLNSPSQGRARDFVQTNRTGSFSVAGSKPSSPYTGGGGVGTRADFAKSVLLGIGAPTTSQNVTAMLAWMQAENTNAKNNPLATTQGMKGRQEADFNKVGVKNYTDFDAGVAATVKTLKNGRYENLLKNLLAGNMDDPFASARADMNTWGTGGGASAALPGVRKNPEKYATAPLAHIGDPGIGGGARQGNINLTVHIAQASESEARAFAKRVIAMMNEKNRVGTLQTGGV